MTNERLKTILANYPSECEILVLKNDYEIPIRVSVEYEENNDFTLPKIIIEV